MQVVKHDVGMRLTLLLWSRRGQSLRRGLYHIIAHCAPTWRPSASLRRGLRRGSEHCVLPNRLFPYCVPLADSPTTIRSLRLSVRPSFALAFPSPQGCRRRRPTLAPRAQPNVTGPLPTTTERSALSYASLYCTWYVTLVHAAVAPCSAGGVEMRQVTWGGTTTRSRRGSDLTIVSTRPSPTYPRAHRRVQDVSLSLSRALLLTRDAAVRWHHVPRWWRKRAISNRPTDSRLALKRTREM